MLAAESLPRYVSRGCSGSCSLITAAHARRWRARTADVRAQDAVAESTDGAQPPRTAARALARVGVVGFGLGGAEPGVPPEPTTAATAWAIRITVPDQSPRSDHVDRRPTRGTSSGRRLHVPGRRVGGRRQSTTATRDDRGRSELPARGLESDVTGLSLFGGEITADAVTARASAGTGSSGAGGNAERKRRRRTSWSRASR